MANTSAENLARQWEALKRRKAEEKRSASYLSKRVSDTAMERASQNMNQVRQGVQTLVRQERREQLGQVNQAWEEANRAATQASSERRRERAQDLGIEPTPTAKTSYSGIRSERDWERLDLGPGGLLPTGSGSPSVYEQLADLSKQRLALQRQVDEDTYRTQREQGYREMSILDATWNSATRGYNNSHYGQELSRMRDGRENEAQRYEDILSGEQYRYTTRNPVKKAISGAAELLGQQVMQLTAPETIGMTAGGAGLALAAGNAGPQALVPEEIFTVPLAAGLGLKTATGMINAEIEGGLAYKELLDNGVSEETARKISAVVGGINGALEFVQMDGLLKSFRILARNPSTYGAAELLQKAVKEYTGRVLTETSQEIAQEAVTIGGNQLGTYLEQGKPVYSTGEVLDRLKETGISSALSFGILGAPGAGLNVANIGSGVYHDAKLGADLSGLGDDMTQAVIAKGLESAEGTEIRRLAEQLQRQLSEGKRVTNSQLGRLYRANAGAIAAEESAQGAARQEQAEEPGPVLEPEARTDLLSQAAAQAVNDGKVSNRMAERLLGDAESIVRLERDAGLELREGLTNAQRRAEVKGAVQRYAATMVQAEDGKGVTATSETVSERVSEEEGTRIPPRTRDAQEAAQRPGFRIPEAYRAERSEDAAQNVAKLEQAVRTGGPQAFGEQGQKTILSFYDGTSDLTEYYGSFAVWYQAGMTGLEKGKVKDRYSWAMNQAQREAAWLAGQVDAQASLEAEKRNVPFVPVYSDEHGLVESLSGRRLDASEARVLNQVARDLKMQILVADSLERGADGFLRNGRMELSRDAKAPLLSVGSHEVAHRIQELAPEAFRVYQDYSIRKISEINGYDAVHEIQYRYAKSGVNLSTEQAMNEVTAEFTQKMFEDGKLFQEFAGQHRSVARKILDALKRFIRKVRNVFSRAQVEQDSEAMRVYGVDMETLEQAAKLWQAAYDAAAEQAQKNLQAQQGQKNTAQEGGEKRYSIIRTKDGKAFVRLDRAVLSDNNPRKWGKQIVEYINNEIRKGKDLAILCDDGDTITLTSETAGKASHAYKPDGTPFTTEEYFLKLTAEAHIDELLQVSWGDDISSDFEHRHGELAERGWQYRTAFFQIYDPTKKGDEKYKYYMVRISVAMGANGVNTAYHIGVIKERSLPDMIGSSAESGAPKVGRASSEGSVTHTSAEVKSQISETTEAAEAKELSDGKTQYSIRREPPPKKTGVAYKVFYAKNGQLYPAMVANPGGEGTPVGVWLNADAAPLGTPSKTGRMKVQAGGKGTSTGKTQLAYRPGWHLGDIPLAKQFARVNPETGVKDLFPADFVWAECEYAADVDYQQEAESYGYTENGKYRHSYAGLPKLPTDGYYRYRTNPNPDTVPWIITGAMRVKRVLTDAETDAICREKGVEPMQRQGGPLDAATMLERFGIQAGDQIEGQISDDGTKFSLGAPVERAKNLVALHNLNAEKLKKALRIGGFPMPSIAITRTDIPHTNFGDITLVFGRDTIDPQADRRNTAYSADAWTPTFPVTEYEADSKVSARLRDKFYELSQRFGREAVNALYPWGNYAEGQLNSEGGEEAALTKLRGDTDMMQVYLLDNGMTVPEPVKTETVTRLEEDEIREYDHLIDTLGRETFEEMSPIGGESIMAARRRWIKDHGGELEEAYRAYQKESRGAELQTIPPKFLVFLAANTRNYLKNGPETRTSTVNVMKTQQAIREAVNQEDYHAWLTDLFGGIEKSSGIYNGKDRYTRSGNPRSFKATHLPVTLENIAKAMAAEGGGDSRNVSGFYGVKSLRAGMAARFASIDDMHELEGRLKHLTEEEAAQINDALGDRLSALLDRIYATKPHSEHDNQLIAFDSIGNLLMDACRAPKVTVDSITKAFSGTAYKISTPLAAEIRDLLFDISEMPVNIFEAKPERAVRFDEVLAAIVPSDTEQALIQQLENAGVRTITYLTGDDADRLAKVNSVDEATFSLSRDDKNGLAALRRENARLQARVEYWRSQLKRTENGQVDPKAVTQVAKRLIKDYGADLEVSDISGDLLALYDYMGTGKDGKDGRNDFSDAEVRRRSLQIARTLIEAASETDDAMYQEYKDLREYLRKTKITLSQRDIAGIPEFGHLRKKNMGRLNIRSGATNVDQVYQELMESWPGLFQTAADSAVIDQFLTIVSVLEDVYRVTEYNPFSWDMEEATVWLSNDIIESFFDQPNIKKTFADRAAAQLEAERGRGRERVRRVRDEKNARIKEVRAEERARGQEQVKRVRDEKNQRIAEVREKERARGWERVQQVREEGNKRIEAERERGRERVRQTQEKANERIAKIREQGRERVRKAIQRERENKAKQVQRLKDHYAQQRAAQAARRQDSKMRDRLLKIVRRLKNKKLPEANRALLDEYIGDLDAVAKSMTGKTLKKLTDLRLWYEDQLKNDPDFIPDKRIEERLKRLERRQIADLTPEEVAQLTEVLLHIENELATEKKLIDSADRRDTYHMAEQVIADVEASGGNRGPLEFASDFFVTQTLSPVREARRMTGWAPDDPLVSLMEGLSAGQRAMLTYQMQAEQPFRVFAKDKVFAREFSGPKAKVIEISGLTADGIKTVEITPAMRVSLYLHSLNPQSLRHIRDGGISIPDIKRYRKGDIAGAYNNDTILKLTPSQIKSITRQMTPKERQFAELVRRYFRDVSKPAINAVSEKLKGYSIAQEEDYYPIHVDPSFTRTDFESIKFDGSMEGMGFLKDRQAGASNAILLRDANAELEQSIRLHSKYVGLGIPVRNFNKVWGVTARNFEADASGFESSVQKAVRRMWGQEGLRYIEKLMSDLQNGRKQQGAMAAAVSKLRSNYAGAVLTLNGVTAIKQAASYPTAAAVLGWGPLVRAMGDVGRVDLELIARYTPLQWYRSLGYSTQELGDMQRPGAARIPSGLNWIQGTDLLTTRKLWKASEYYVRGQHKDLTRGTDAYYRAVAEVYNRVIEETQPNYTVMQRPQLLRSDNQITQVLNMFKTQLYQNFGILYDATGAYTAAVRRQDGVTEARRDLARAVSSQVVQLGVVAAMTFLGALALGRKRKYEDEDGELTAESVLPALGKDMAGGLFASVPAGSEVWELASSKLFGDRWYGIELSIIDTANDLISDTMGMTEQCAALMEAALHEEEIDWNETRLELSSHLDGVSKAAGIPYENALKLLTAAVRHTLTTAKGKYLGEYYTLLLTESPDAGSRDYMDLLYRSMARDPEAYAVIYADMEERGLYDGTRTTADGAVEEVPTKVRIRSAMESRMVEAAGVKTATELDKRWLPPEADAGYEAIKGQVTDSEIWSRATQEQRDKALEQLYTLQWGGKQGEEIKGKVDGGRKYGLALSVVDQPNESGKLGSYTNAERKAAIELIPGLSKRERAYLWDFSGNKNNPWR